MWIIGDGGSPERAPSDTLESCSFAVSEWADGVLVRLWSTADNQIILAPRPILPAVGGDIDIEKSSNDDRESRPAISPLTGSPYRLSSFPEFLQFLALTPVRGFLEVSERLLASSALELFRDLITRSVTRLPLHIVLPPDLPLPALGPSVTLWRRSSDHFPVSDKVGVSWILDNGLLNDTPPMNLPRFLVNGHVPDVRWPLLRHLPNFWGVVTPTPYFTRKILDTKGSTGR